MMLKFDLAISYKWIYDEEFVQLIEDIFHRYGSTTFLIRNYNIDEVIDRVNRKELQFKAYLDRASDEDRAFEPISKLLQRHHCYLINPHNKVLKATDKSAMHKRLLKKKFRLPDTHLVPQYSQTQQLKLNEYDLTQLGSPFVIKPAVNSGGGEGVIRNAVSLQQIIDERIIHPNEKFLIQEKIKPRFFAGRRAWFRVLWAFNKAIPIWWDDQTHIYNIVTKKETARFNLLPLSRITSKLARITKLDYFSTEIAVTKDHNFVMIDYVNDQCDMRLKSNHPDGVPNEVVAEFIERMRRKVLSL
ncbi:MAG: hypothetical protein M1495_05010 [Bacteroidetes bacterium]|nr:hypothetical protein [Bacteroidota bacterium]